MKKIILLFIVLAYSNMLFGATGDLNGTKIFIDPGHGGHEGDDRGMPSPLTNQVDFSFPSISFWESDSNLVKAFYLEQIIKEFDSEAEVDISRRGNIDAGDEGADDPSLYERAVMAETFGADVFVSIHSNAAASSAAHYGMMIYNGVSQNGSTSSLDATLDENLADALTGAYNASERTVDSDYYAKTYNSLVMNPTWKTGYGVISVVDTIAAVISEGSFHDYQAENLRLLNDNYRKNEARIIFRGILNYLGLSDPTGSISGIVQDVGESAIYYKVSGDLASWSTDEVPEAVGHGDAKKPIDNIVATLYDSTGTTVLAVCNGDAKRNGYYFFDGLDPADYQVKVEAAGFPTKTVPLTVSAGSVVSGNMDFFDPSTFATFEITKASYGSFLQKKIEIILFDPDVCTVNVDWGDGTLDKPDSEAIFSVEHTYDEAGEYTISVTEVYSGDTSEPKTLSVSTIGPN